MKVVAQRADASALRLRQQGQREATSEEAARRFQKQLQRRRKEEEAVPTGMAGPFELMVWLGERQEPPSAIASSVPMQDQHFPEPALAQLTEVATSTDLSNVQRHMEDSLRMDTIARASLEAGVKMGMAHGTGEYQVELGCALFKRTRLRVRAGGHLGIEVRCESENASEREWFARHRETLATRMAALTGRAVKLDIADLGL